MSRFDRLLAAALAAAFVVLTLAGCESSTQPKGPQLTIIAGSELKDLEPMQADLEKAAGMPLAFTYAGSLEAVERLEAGDQFDALWVSHGKYLQQTESLKPRIKAAERTMASPVILGVKQSIATSLGWTDKEPTWAEISQAAAGGKLSYAMTSPTASNTGFTALVGTASALAGTGDAIDLKAIKTDSLTALFKGQKFVAGSSGWLADAFVARQDSLDGMINYESVILQLNASGKLREPLVPIYPKEGIVTADYPLMLLDENKREAYQRLVNYLRSPEVQTRISRETLRRPVVPAVAPAPDIPERVLIELPFPASRPVMDALIDAYQGQLRRPASTYFVVDISGSMEGDGMNQLQASLAGLAGGDATLTGRFAQFQPREQVYILPFSTQPEQAFEATLPPVGDDASAALEGVRRFAKGLLPDGGTAIFSSVQVAYQRALADRAQSPDRQFGIVVMTDGANNQGLTQSEFLQWYENLPAPDRGIPVFCLLFGKAAPAQLEAIAQATGGRVFDGRKDLRAAFKAIRGYL